MAHTTSEKRFTASRIEWPTLATIAAFWVAFVSLVVFHAALPTVVVVVVLAVLGCFYLSLQHEVIHGHPTASLRFNHALVFAPLSLVEPFSSYRRTHLDHHASDLTNPLDDPESHYVSPEVWRRAGPLRRGILQANRSLAGRLTIGPVRGTLSMWLGQARHHRSDPAIRLRWLGHLVGVALVVVALRAAGIPMWIYLLGFVFGGASLTALRSFVEHSAHDDQPRSAIVQSNWFFGLLFLNNNLHYTHHRLPGATWYRLPQLTRDLDSATIVADGAGFYEGYLEVARRHMFRSFCQPVNPLLETIDR